MRNFNKTFHNSDSTNSNFIILWDKNYGDFLFGSPPEIIKYFALEKKTIPSNIVIPQRTFRSGRNFFDLEFVIYTILFTKSSKDSINLICTKLQRERFHTVLKEALFGPSLNEILISFLRDDLKVHLNKNIKQPVSDFITDIGDDIELYKSFKESVKHDKELSKVSDTIEKKLNAFSQNHHWGKTFYADGIPPLFTQAYIRAATLKNEMDYFSICEAEDEIEFINSFVRFKVFDAQGKVHIKGIDEKELTIVRLPNGSFDICEGGEVCDNIDLLLTNEIKKDIEIATEPLKIPNLGVTFIGLGTGFDPTSYTPCMLFWIKGKAIAIDLIANCEVHFKRLGIASNDISSIFLSHLHADHDPGVVEKIISGEKTKVFTSRVIFDSFLRKARALTNFQESTIEEFVDFTNLDIEREIPIPGMEGAFIEFGYGFHSIPAGRFKIRYVHDDGTNYTIGFSGDTKFDDKLVEKLYKEGTLTKERKEEILNFLWDCDLIFHEAGGGMLHTSVEKLLELPNDIRKKIILYHAEEETRKNTTFRYVEEGETLTIYEKETKPSKEEMEDLIKQTGLFPDITDEKLTSLLNYASVENLKKGDFIFKQGDIGDKMHFIISGFVEIIKHNEVINIYEKGDFIGELAILEDDHTRKASVRARSNCILMTIGSEVFKKYHLSTAIREKIYELPNFFSDTPPSSLTGYLSRGELISYKKGENIITVGDDAKEIFIITSGEVDIISSDGTLIDRTQAVDIIGEMAYLTSAPRKATVKVTSKEATAVKLDMPLFKKVIDRFPSFYATLLIKMKRRQKIIEAF
ncbi:MAG: cyclic nucleotide-binding domain-containing protein [Nitrospinae bacterium]|nr:cyclic nucleotide-binding domain-containing protein [Nitrospinota bacterium]